jgi:hypothetical protein
MQLQKTRLLNLFASPTVASLFSVNPDVQTEDALAQASTFIATSMNLIQELAYEVDSDSAWAAYYMLEMAQALVDASRPEEADEDDEYASEGDVTLLQTAVNS